MRLQQCFFLFLIFMLSLLFVTGQRPGKTWMIIVEKLIYNARLSLECDRVYVEKFLIVLVDPGNK